MMMMIAKVTFYFLALYNANAIVSYIHLILTLLS